MQRNETPQGEIMQRYEVMQAMHADNPAGRCVPFKSGQIITGSDMLAGCLEAGIARQTIRPVVEKAPEPATGAAASSSLTLPEQAVTVKPGWRSKK